MVRTPGFHPGNRGPIPLGATNKENLRFNAEIFVCLVMGKIVYVFDLLVYFWR